MTPEPSVLPTVAPEPLRTDWAMKWSRQAKKNRVGLTRVYSCVGWGKPAKVPKRPGASASQRDWSRYGNKCKRLAIVFVKKKKAGLRLIFHPKIVNYMDWKPTVKWYWPEATDIWSCPKCGASGTTRTSRVLHTINHESGGVATAHNGVYHGLMQETGGSFNGPTNIRVGYRYFLSARAYGGCGWEPWPWW